MQMYYTSLILFCIISLSQCKFLIGTGKGILTVVGDNVIQEVKWNPSSFGTSNQVWSCISDPKFTDGCFMTSDLNKVWDVEGFSSTPGTRVIAYARKDLQNDPKNQRWVWTEDHKVYSTMNCSAFATITPQGLTLDVEKSTNQIFTPVDPTPIKATIRNYLPSLGSVSVTTPFGTYNFGNARYQVITVLKGFLININDANGVALRPVYPVGTDDKCGITLVLGTPVYPTGSKAWTMRKIWNGTNTIQNYRCNMTFSGNTIYGSIREVVVSYNATTKKNETTLSAPMTITGGYKTDGSIRMFFNFVNHYKGLLFTGAFYTTTSPSSTTISGDWEDLDARNDQSNGFFEFTMQN